MEIIATLFGFLLFCLLLLALPVELSFSFEKRDTPAAYQARVHWLFGLIAIDITGKEGKPKARLLKKKPKKTRRHWDAILGGEISITQVIRLIRGLLGSLQIKELTFHGRIGLGDPACTGMLFSVLHPLLIPGRHITLIADFHEAVFEGHGKVSIRLFPIRIIGALLAFIVSNRR